MTHRLLKSLLILVPVVFVAQYVFGSSFVTVPTPETIRSADGNIEIGVSRQYGGAIVYLKDNRVGSTNILDYSNGGALFTTAIWTLPPNSQETKMCEEQYKVAGNCPGTIPFNNPTQGGYLADGWAGNPNQPTVTVANNKIIVSYRSVNYNYDYVRKPLTESNRSEWQTDMWGDLEIYFHPTLPHVIVVETKITYCKDNNSGCKNKTIVTQDNQLSTFFGAGESYPDPFFRGPFTRTAYYNRGNLIINTSAGTEKANTDENWVAILHKNNNTGVGMKVKNYGSTVPSRFGYSLGPAPSMAAIQPELSRFENSGITRKTSVVVNGETYSDIPRYEFSPGGWYEFTTFVATGDISEIRQNLLQVDTAVLAVNRPPTGTLDATISSSGQVTGFAYDRDHPTLPINVHFYVDNPAGSGTFAGSTLTNSFRSNINIAGNRAGFTFTIPENFRDGKEHRLYAHGIDLNDNTGASNLALDGNPRRFTLRAASAPQPTISSFTAAPTTISAGSSTTLAWNVTGATSVSISGIGSVSGTSRSVSPAVTTTYTLTATNASGSVTRSVTVNVSTAYATPYSYQTPYITPSYGTPYTTPYSTPSYGTPYTTPYSTPYATPYMYPTPASSSNQIPRGYLDAANCSVIGGWAYDPDDSSEIINVHVYDGMAGSGRFLQSVLTTGIRPDVNSAFGITGSHGYTISTPDSLKDGKNHSVYVYAIDSSLNGSNPALTGSPITVNCSPVSSVESSSLLASIGSIFFSKKPKPVPIPENTTVTVVSSPYVFSRELSKGSMGKEVSELQKFLKKEGLYAGNIDGVFGIKLKAAVMEFQAKNNLKSDGLVGPAMIKTLNR